MIEFLTMNPGMVFDKDRIYEKVCGYENSVNYVFHMLCFLRVIE